MPWHLSENGLCVIKDGEEEPLKCYESKEEAVDYMQALYASEKSANPPALMITYTPGAVKAVGDWELEVLGVPFGGPLDGKDTDGQYFSENTNTYKEYFKTIPVYYYHSINPDGRSMQDEPALIGTAKYVRTDKKGHWFRVQLNKTVEFAKRIWESAKRGLARASSGSLSHIVRVAKDGEITHWPVAELSLIDAEGKRQPANAWAVATPVMKANYEKAELEFPVIPSSDDNTTANDLDSGAQDAGKASERTEELGAVTTPIKGEHEMEEKDVLALVEAKFKAEKEAQEAAAKTEAEIQAKIDAAVAVQVEAIKAEAAQGRRLPMGDGAPYVTKYADTNKFDNIDAGGQAVMIGILESAKKEVSPAAYKALALKLEEDKSPVGEDGRRAMKAAGVKADEMNYSTSTTYGSYWVGTAYSRSLWESIRVGTFVVGKLPQIEVPEGFSSIYIPLESTDPTWYHVGESTAYSSSAGATGSNLTSSYLGTSQKQLTIDKLGALSRFSGEMSEDSLIPWLPQLQAQFAKSGAEYLESAIIDGHTSTTSLVNINCITGAAAADGAYYLAWDGFRVSPLVTTTTNSRSGGTLTVEDYLETVKLMGTSGINALDTSKVSFIIDPATNYKTLALPELMTKDVYSQPTIEGGKLVGIWGYGVNVSGSICKMSSNRLSNSAGKIEVTTATNNIYGQILAVRWDQWMFGWKRRMTIETTRIPVADATEIVAMFRCGLVQRDTEASAITYGVSV